jgi:hypothetical protein
MHLKPKVSRILIFYLENGQLVSSNNLGPLYLISTMFILILQSTGNTLNFLQLAYTFCFLYHFPQLLIHVKPAFMPLKLLHFIICNEHVQLTTNIYITFST